LSVKREVDGHSELSARVVGEILGLIEKRQYLPGERLPSERDLAERFAVGRATVREAVTTLESMRYVERRAGSGIYRSRAPETASLEALVLFTELGLPLDPRVNAEAVEVRRIIEVQAIALACERRTTGDLGLLSSVLARYATGPDFPAAAPQYDYDFHMGIFRATQNDLLVRLVTPFYIMSRTRRDVFFRDLARCRVSHQQHIKLFKAIECQDTAKAMELMAAHIGRVERYFK
jgi:GntR family transcriptional regulator, transcriptional repressor for pyruvate dehydrogenase complex